MVVPGSPHGDKFKLYTRVGHSVQHGGTSWIFGEKEELSVLLFEMCAFLKSSNKGRRFRNKFEANIWKFK